MNVKKDLRFFEWKLVDSMTLATLKNLTLCDVNTTVVLYD